MARTKGFPGLKLSSLPKIIDATRELGRAIENEADASPEDEAPIHPARSVYVATKRLRELLNPSGCVICFPSLTPRKNPDIDGADLERPIRVLLRELWEKVIRPDWTLVARDRPDEAAEILDDIANALENVAPTKTSPLVIDGNRILVNGTPIAIDMTPNRAADVRTFLAALIVARGNWISSSEINEVEEKKMHGRPGVRWDRILKALPAEITTYIESNRRKGYRIRVS